jgi:hypothetical protein
MAFHSISKQHQYYITERQIDFDAHETILQSHDSDTVCTNSICNTATGVMEIAPFYGLFRDNSPIMIHLINEQLCAEACHPAN